MAGDGACTRFFPGVSYKLLSWRYLDCNAGWDAPKGVNKSAQGQSRASWDAALGMDVHKPIFTLKGLHTARVRCVDLSAFDPVTIEDVADAQVKLVTNSFRPSCGGPLKLIGRADDQPYYRLKQ